MLRPSFTPLPCCLLASDPYLAHLPVLLCSGVIAPTPRALTHRISTPRALPPAQHRAYTQPLHLSAPRDCVQDPCTHTPPHIPDRCPDWGCVDAGDCLDLSRDNAGTVADVACAYASVQCQPTMVIDGVAQAVAQGVSGAVRGKVCSRVASSGMAACVVLAAMGSCKLRVAVFGGQTCGSDLEQRAVRGLYAGAVPLFNRYALYQWHIWLLVGKRKALYKCVCTCRLGVLRAVRKPSKWVRAKSVAVVLCALHPCTFGLVPRRRHSWVMSVPSLFLTGPGHPQAVLQGR